MVRAKRVGAKEKLAAMTEENARLRAMLANPQAAADEMIADAPNGITIVGTDAPKVTGGMTRQQAEEKIFGKKWWVKVTELALPNASDIQQVASYCNNGEFIKTFRANTEVLLPESEIKKLEEYAVVEDRIPVNVGIGGMTPEKAQEYNPDMTLQQDTQGQYWLVRTRPRFIVRRIRPEQESITIQ